MGLVSIICPTYNEEPFIEACIQSVLAQDLPCEQWELLLVDGGSTDQTRTLIVPYLKRHTNIRLLDNPHRTVPYAMNIGIRAAQGEYVWTAQVFTTRINNPRIKDGIPEFTRTTDTSKGYTYNDLTNGVNINGYTCKVDGISYNDYVNLHNNNKLTDSITLKNQEHMDGVGILSLFQMVKIKH